MSKFTVGQGVELHVPSVERAANFGIHVIDDKVKLFSQVVFVNEEEKTVNIVVSDHVGTKISLLDVSTVKPKDEDQFYVSSLAK